MTRLGWNFVLVALALAFSCIAADKGTNATESTEATYSRTLEKRATDILASLQLRDSVAAEKVHDFLIAHYRALRDWHNTNDATVKTASAESVRALTDSLRDLHARFLANLSTQLNPAQLEIVKDKMTYNKVKVTYDAYCASHPQLTDTQKAQVLELLKQAREEAMDAGSSDEKNKIFRKYKGRINNYLSGKSDK